MNTACDKRNRLRVIAPQSQHDWPLQDRGGFMRLEHVPMRALEKATQMSDQNQIYHAIESDNLAHTPWNFEVQI